MRATLPLCLSGLILLACVVAAPAAAPVVAGNTNLAAAANGGRIVAVSSEVVDDKGKVIPEWAATNLIDGKFVVGNYTPADSYGWATQLPPSEEKPEWVMIGFTDLASGKDVTRLISRICIDPTTDDTPLIGRWVRTFSVEVSSTNVNGPWKRIASFEVANRAVKQAFDFPPTEARYVRVRVTSNHGSDKCVEMGEVEIYEAIVPSNQLDQLIVRLENLLDDLKRYRDGQLYQQQQASLTAAGVKPPPEAQPGGAQPAPPTTPAGGATPAGPGERLDLGLLTLEVPADWQRAQLEGAGANVKLFLMGPVLNGERVGLTVTQEALQPGTTLVDFVADLIDQWPGASLGESASVKIGDAEARRISLTTGNRTFINYCFFNQGQGITLTAAVPASAVEQAGAALQPIVNSIKLKTP